MSSIFKLNTNDLIKGLVVAIITALLNTIVQLLQNNGSFDLKQLGAVALTAGLSYLLKNFITDDEGKIAGKI